MKQNDRCEAYVGDEILPAGYLGIIIHPYKKDAY